jgi:hypothetical protein
MTDGNLELRTLLLIEEYKLLRERIATLIKENFELERYSVIGTGLIYAWLASLQTPSFLVLPAWVFPPVLTILGMIRSEKLARRVEQLAFYVKSIEDTGYNNMPPYGWENVLELAKKDGKTPSLSKNRRLYWYILISFTVLSSIYGFTFQLLKALKIG